MTMSDLAKFSNDAERRTCPW